MARGVFVFCFLGTWISQRLISSILSSTRRKRKHLRPQRKAFWMFDYFKILPQLVMPWRIEWVTVRLQYNAKCSGDTCDLLAWIFLDDMRNAVNQVHCQPSVKLSSRWVKARYLSANPLRMHLWVAAKYMQTLLNSYKLCGCEIH